MEEKMKIGDIIYRKIDGKAFEVVGFDKISNNWLIKDKEEYVNAIKLNEAWQCSNCKEVYETEREAHDCCVD